jgi:hypothetical protein
MNHHDDEPRDFRSREQGFTEPRPDQYGQEHYGRKHYDPQQQAEVAGSSGQFGQSRHEQRHRWQSGDSRDWQGRQTRDWQGGEPRDGRAEHSRGFSNFRQPSDYNPAASGSHEPPFSLQPSGHAPFNHSAFGESGAPRYFGTGSQGHGGGPSFTGGTFGTADWRSDSPYFDEVGFNRGNYEDPLARETGYQAQYRARSGVADWRRVERRYPPGPKGYQRSDERLREDISERLMQAYDIDSSEVTVQVLGGKVVLEGTVPTRFMKHAIEDIADVVPGVQDVDNRLRVINARSWGATSAEVSSSATNVSNTTTSGTTSNGRSGTRRDS